MASIKSTLRSWISNIFISLIEWKKKRVLWFWQHAHTKSIWNGKLWVALFPYILFIGYCVSFFVCYFIFTVYLHVCWPVCAFLYREERKRAKEINIQKKSLALGHRSFLNRLLFITKIKDRESLPVSSLLRNYRFALIKYWTFRYGTACEFPPTASSFSFLFFFSSFCNQCASIFYI